MKGGSIMQSKRKHKANRNVCQQAMAKSHPLLLSRLHLPNLVDIYNMLYNMYVKSTKYSPI